MFCFNDTATTEIYTLSLHDALPISSGFAALPGGYRNSTGAFGSVPYDGNWWSAAEASSTYAWYRYLNYNNAQVFRNNYTKAFGFSVRCLRD